MCKMGHLAVSNETIALMILYTICCVQGSGSRSNHRKCFKKCRKMAKKSGKYILKKGMVLTIVMLFDGFVYGSDYTSNYTK